MATVQDIALRSKPRAPMQTAERVEVSIDRGIDGDFRGSQKGRQVTLLSRQAWQKACAEVQADLPWTTRRANLLVDGIDFSESDVGRLIRVGEVELIVTEETDPCSRMDEQQAGLTAALEPDWRGGVCCDVTRPGVIRTGDSVEFA